MATTVECGPQEHIERMLCLRHGGDPSTEAGDIGIVVAATHLGILGSAQHGGARTGDLVGSHADT